MSLTQNKRLSRYVLFSPISAAVCSVSSYVLPTSKMVDKNLFIKSLWAFFVEFEVIGDELAFLREKN